MNMRSILDKTGRRERLKPFLGGKLTAIVLKDTNVKKYIEPDEIQKGQ